MLYSCTDIRNIVGGDKLGVATRHEDPTRNTAKEVFQQSTKHMDPFISQINCSTWNIHLYFMMTWMRFEWIEYVGKREREREGGGREIERAREREGKRERERDVRLSIASLYSFTFL